MSNNFTDCCLAEHANGGFPISDEGMGFPAAGKSA
jgi:hypothetical protein